MADGERPPLYRWMDAWMGPDGPAPTTRHVLHALASHMDGSGEDCWPGTRRLSEETGRARKTVRRHLELAKDAGWITWTEEAGDGQAWRRRRYRPTYPANVGDPDSPTSKVGEVGDPDSPTSDRKVGELRGQGGGTEGEKVGDPDSPRVPMRDSRSTQGGGAHPRGENGGRPSAQERARDAWAEIREAGPAELGALDLDDTAADVLEELGGSEGLEEAAGRRFGLEELGNEFKRRYVLEDHGRSPEPVGAEVTL